MWYQIDFIRGYILMPVFGREVLMPINKHTISMCQWVYDQITKDSKEYHKCVECGILDKDAKADFTCTFCETFPTEEK